MQLFNKIYSFCKKIFKIINREGVLYFLNKGVKRIVVVLFGKNFPQMIFRLSYRSLWKKIFEFYYTNSLPIFLFRFIVSALFGWIIIFLPKRPFIAATQEEIDRWFVKNKRKVTVVIPTYNDYQLTRNCVESIKKLPSAKFVDIIVVDDGSSQEVRNKLEGLKPLVKLILKDKNEGFAKTCNVGINATKTGDVLLLNNDTIVHPGWIETLQFYAYLDKQVGIVGAKLLYPDATIQWAGTHRNLEATQWFDHNFRFKPYDWPAANVPCEVLAVTGACMYIRRVVIDKIGVLDPNFEMAFEDVDYSLRAWEAGFKCFYAPKAVVTHYESKTRGFKQGKREMQSLKYFWKKWGNWFDGRNIKNEKGQIKVIYVMQDTGVAGGHKVIYEHLNGLMKAGYDVSLYALAKAPTWFPLKVPVKSFRSYKALEAELRNQEAIKVATWWETSPSVWRASVTKGIPVYFVQDIETSYYNSSDSAAQNVLAWYKKEFKYLTTSTWNKQQLQNLGLQSSIVSPAIDNKIFRLRRNIKRDDNTILSVGRSHPLKNLDFTIKAWKSLKPEVRPKLVIFGIEPILGVKIGAEYVFSPSDEEVANLYNRATVFIQTSRHEGFCLPILEAMACGAAVICTNADGNMDFSVDGENCILVEQDNLKQLTSAIVKVIGDRKLRKKLIRGGLKTAKNYTWRQKIKELDIYFRNLNNGVSTFTARYK